VLALEFLDEVIDKTVIEIFSTQVSVASSSLDLEDTLLNGQERHIECTSTQIEDENVALADYFLVETVRDSRGCRFVDDAEDIQPRDRSGVFGGLTLRIIEVCRYRDDGIGNRGTEIGFCRLLHFREDHGGNFFGRLKISFVEFSLLGEALRAYEFLVFATVLNSNVRLAALVQDLEWEVLDIGLHFCVFELPTDETLGVEDPKIGGVNKTSLGHRIRPKTYVLCGFMATWFFAASPINRSLSENET
jgi:hypothetical protein